MPWYTPAAAWVAKQLRKVAIWVVFVVLLALLPLILVYNDKRTGGGTFTMDELLAGGELLLVVTAVGADSIGRIISSAFSPNRTRRPDLWELLLLLACFVFVILAASEYSSLITRLSLKANVDAAYVVSQSKAFFFATLMTGIGAILTVDE